MYKKLLSVISVVALLGSCKKDDGGGGGNGSGDPQITSADFTLHHTANSQASGYLLDSGIIKIPTASTSLALDYSTVIKGANWSDSFKTPANTTDYSTATYMRGISQQILGQSLSLNQYYKVSSSNWTNLGSYLGTAANITIPTIGTINVPVQAAKQTPEIPLVNFPIAYGDSIGATSANVITTQVTGTVTIPATPPLTTPTTITLNNEPLTITQTTTVNSKNMAWGTMQLKDYTGSMQVVVQRYKTAIKTDFNFPNNPLYNLALNSILTTTFNTTNGQTVTLTSYRFWVPGKGLVMTLNTDGSANVTTGL